MTGTILTIVSAGLTAALGIIYLTRPRFMGYHSKAVGKEWAELPAGMQTLILALMRTTSSGLLSVAAAIIILQIEFNKYDYGWIAWTILLIGTLLTGISLYGMLMVRTKTMGRPPVVPVIILYILLLAGFFFNILG